MRDMYDPKSLSVPPNFVPVHPFDNGDLLVRDETLNGWPRTEDDIRKHTHDYYAFISSMDFDLGRLFGKVNELGLDENTIIVYTSDQGMAMGSHGLLGKQSIYESTMKVPFLISGPGIRPGQTDAFAYLHDIYPTVCDMVGAEVPDDLDGASLAGVIAGKQDKVRDTVMLAYLPGYWKNNVGYQRSIRVGDWKLIRYPKVDRTQLFNLAEDPYECKDVSAAPANQDKVDELMAQLEMERKHYGDIRPLVVPESELRPAEFKFPNSKGPARRSGGLAPNDIERNQ